MTNGMKVELESLSNDMFAPLSEKEASLVVGGVASQIIGVTGYDCTIYWAGGGTSDDFLITDTINSL